MAIVRMPIGQFMEGARGFGSRGRLHNGRDRSGSRLYVNGIQLRYIIDFSLKLCYNYICKEGEILLPYIIWGRKAHAK